MVGRRGKNVSCSLGIEEAGLPGSPGFTLLVLSGEGRTCGVPTRDRSMPQQKTRSARIEARITPDGLAIVKRAAEIQGRSVSDFVVAAAQEAAYQTIERVEIIRLSVEDQRLLAEALLNPPDPAPALVRAAENHRRLVRRSE